MNEILMIGALATFIKLLFAPMYRSTDFEVHRNWLALTHNLSYHKWYYENTSEWTLDYPPLFAWFEYSLSQVAKYFDAEMLKISNLNYASDSTILFQRISVILSDFVLIYATYRCCSVLQGNHDQKWKIQKSMESSALAVLVIFNAGLLIVDHIHFQYNGFLTGMLFLSLYHVVEGRVLWGSFWFAILLNFKHIYLYMAPAYGIFLLRTYCMNPRMKGLAALFSFSPIRLIQLAVVVIGIFTASFGPFKDHIPQVFSRLFPFKRGLTHAYWAPNFWALYNFCDKILSMLAVKMNLITSDKLKSSFSRGLVEEAEHVIFPSPSPLTTMVITLLFILPCVLDLWFRPRGLSTKHLGTQFLRSVVFVSLTSYMFGWHVHEKAILLAILPLTILAVKGTRKDGEIFLVLQAVGHYSLFPLLFQSFELVTKVCIVLVYNILAFELVKRLRKSDINVCTWWKLPLIHPFETLYIYGLLFCEIYCSGLHRYMPYAANLKFLPLMITSTYCALGVTWCWCKIGYTIITDVSGCPIEKRVKGKTHNNYPKSTAKVQ